MKTTISLRWSLHLVLLNEVRTACNQLKNGQVTWHRQYSWGVTENGGERGGIFIMWQLCMKIWNQMEWSRNRCRAAFSWGECKTMSLSNIFGEIVFFG